MHLMATPPALADPGPPGKYYPFKPPIKPESPLGKLLTSKGVKFHSTRAGSFGAGRRHMSTSVPKTMRAAVVRASVGGGREHRERARVQVH